MKSSFARIQQMMIERGQRYDKPRCLRNVGLQFSPKMLAQRIGERLGYRHELQTMPDDEIRGYLERKLAPVAIQEFLVGVSTADLDTEAGIAPVTEEVDDGLGALP